MNTRIALAVVVVALVAVAGCSDGGTGAQTPTPTPDVAADDGGDAASTDGEPAADATDSQSDGGDGRDGGLSYGDDDTTVSATPTPADGATATPTGTPAVDGEVASAVFDRHAAAVGTEFGYEVSFTLNFTATDGSHLNMSGTDAVNLTTAEQFRRTEILVDGELVTSEYYRPPDSETVSVCTLFDGECYGQQTFDLDGERQQGYDNYTYPYDAAANDSVVPSFRDAGTVETDDGTRHKYVVDDVSQFTDDSSLEYATARIEVFVDPETDLITRFVYDVTFADNSDGADQVRYEISYDRYGAVDVEPPSWYDG